MNVPFFQLDLETDTDASVLRLRLTDGAGQHLAAHQVRFGEHEPALWEGIFDTCAHVRRYAGGIRFTERPASASDLLERIGVFLGTEILGPGPMGELARGVHHRTLLVRLPTPKADANDEVLAAALARVPWEIARPGAGKKPLLERNLVVRVAVAGIEAGSWTAPSPTGDETLRVLLVFAEAPGSRPLTMRLEREELLDLFYDEVMRERQVEVDVLCHGVSREALRSQVESAGGYHVVHWSGHGRHDLLELYRAGGGREFLSGEELVELFAAAGGFIPHLVFLGACHSGTMVTPRNWAALRDAMRDGEAGFKARASREEPEEEPVLTRLVNEPQGYTGTALALLRAGVPQVVAMRYEVGDAYARDLARLFYRHLFADRLPKAPASALALARGELWRQQAAEHWAVDHATPLIFGCEGLPLSAPQGRSPSIRFRRPVPQPLLPGSRELDTPAHFVGRAAELTRLRRVLEAGSPAVAVIQGLAGLGKTALAAEAVHLWHRRFDGVFAFQSKPAALTVDELLRMLDQRLALHSQAYRELCDEQPGARIYMAQSAELTGKARYAQLRENLVEALHAERLLLVFDNFETQFEAVAGDSGYASADPEWDALLVHLAKRLPETRSRLIVTTRHRPAALASPERALSLPLGPLPIAEARLFLQETRELRRLAFGDREGQALARRLLMVSRGHPLILSRLGGLAGDPAALKAALDDLEKEGLGRLPDVFTARLSAAEREREREYLEDVAVRWVDLLLVRTSAVARRLLWVITLALEPVAKQLLAAVWSGRSLEEEKLEQLRPLVVRANANPEELREKLDRLLPPELRERLGHPGVVPVAVPVGPLLAELTTSGLLSHEGDVHSFHELVRERVAAWVEANPGECGGRSEADVWEAYGERYGAMSDALLNSGEPGARARAVEAGRRGFTYLVRARAFGRLGRFAGVLVTGTRDPSLLSQIIAELEVVTNQLPEGDVRWGIRTLLADALRSARRPEEALGLYERAEADAEEASSWANVGTIRGNWAIALSEIGLLDYAKTTYLRSVEAYRKANSPKVEVVRSELGAFHIEVMQGDAQHALPAIMRRLDTLRGWWQQHGAGEHIPEAPDTVMLGRTLELALTIATQANLALKRWNTCIDLLVECEEAQGSLGQGEHKLARIRFNQYGPLLRLGMLDDAQQVLEGCLAVYQESGDLQGEAKARSALADLWEERGDRAQATALEREALAVKNRFANLPDRSISHGNLSNYLGWTAEATRHLLAGIVYDVITRHGENLQIKLNNLRIHMRGATDSSGSLELPRLADLLVRPEFDPLRQSLATLKTDPQEVQATIDELVDGVRGAGAGS